MGEGEVGGEGEEGGGDNASFRRVGVAERVDFRT